MLSLCMGQVAYALLTRPPLSILNFIRRIFSKLLARLACVKHAASVHPEPGSNSYFVCILSSLYIFSYTYEVKICFDQTQFRLRSLNNYPNYCFFEFRNCRKPPAIVLPICWLFPFSFLWLNLYTMKFLRFCPLSCERSLF